MEEPPHPPDCPCCRVVVARRGPKRTREDADLSTFLPEGGPTTPRGRGRGGEERGGEGEEEPEEEPEGREDEALIHDALFKAFDAHVEKLDAARLRASRRCRSRARWRTTARRRSTQDATQDEIDGLGVWLAGDEFQGDVNYRTLQKLLTRVDQRGFERSASAARGAPAPWLRRRLAPGAHPLLSLPTRAPHVRSSTWPS